ncbi:MAG: endonuclease/exonuclease/phosphatase family protein [Candidatus Altimarinota bacterium]
MRELNRLYFHFLSGIFALYFLGFVFFWMFPEHFYRDLFINFLPYIIALHLPLVLAYLGFHLFGSDHKRITGSFLLFFLFSLFVQSGLLLSPYFHTTKSFASTERQELKVLSANVLKTNVDYESTLRFVREEDPDVFGLIELTEPFAEAMRALHDDYPHQITFPYKEGFGIGLYSKLPFVNPSIELLPGGIPYIHTVVEVEEQPVQVVLIHAMPPFNPEMFAQRNESLKHIADLTGQSPTIVMGDFNLTPWSTYYSSFVEDSGLVSSRDMWNGLQHSWYSWGFYLPIDHLFVSRDIRVLKYTMGENIGSDHLPIIAELAMNL